MKRDSKVEETRLQILVGKVFEHYLKGVFQSLDECDEVGILIKGWAVKRMYPVRSDRHPGDIDLIVRPSSDLSLLELISKGLGQMQIDLHLGPRHLDTLTFDELYKRSETIELDGVPIRVPCPEDHLRILCVHWLTDGGERKERLWDIYWSVKNRPDTFDWNKCLDVVSRKRQRWITCTIGLAHKYLGLPIDDLPFVDEARELPEWLTKAVESRWDKGVGHIPIHRTLSDRKAFWAQVGKRFPPNPVMATIGMEGDFDAPTRIHYQLGFIFKQARPSIKRIWEVLRPRR